MGAKDRALLRADSDAIVSDIDGEMVIWGRGWTPPAHFDPVASLLTSELLTGREPTDLAGELSEFFDTQPADVHASIRSIAASLRHRGALSDDHPGWSRESAELVGVIGVPEPNP